MNFLFIGIIELISLDLLVEVAQIKKSGGGPQLTLSAYAQVEQTGAHPVLSTELDHPLDVSIRAEAEIRVHQNFLKTLCRAPFG